MDKRQSKSSSGRGIHKKKKKGARAQFDRRKNDERHQQQSNKENLLPEQWQDLSSNGTPQYSKLENGPKGLCLVTTTGSRSGCTWNVHVGDKKVPESCHLLMKSSPCTSSSKVLPNLIRSVDRARLCPGNPEEQFATICHKRGGEMKGERGTGDRIAFIDSTSVVDSKGQSYPCTVRRVDCDILCDPEGPYPQRCRPCQSFRSTLHSSLCRQMDVGDDHTAASSHTRYCNLTPTEKDERMKNLHQSLKLERQRVKRLEMKVSKLIEDQAISLHDGDTADISSIIADVSPVVEKEFPPDSPQRIFWEQQMHYNGLKDKRQMRWHPLVIRFALNLKYLSSSGYRAMRHSGMISLPSECTLSDYTHWASPHSGVQLEFVEQFHSLLAEETSPGQNHCALSMDEMKLKRGLIFNKNTGTLCGFNLLT